MEPVSLCEYIFVLVMALAVTITGESYYSITGPGVIKSNRKYSVVVALHESSDPCSIRVGIEGPNLKLFKDVNLQPFESQVVEFQPKSLQSGNYFLRAEGLSGLTFKNESLLNEILDEGPKIYIQTDKGAYKPQDLVRFRFVVLDEHTKPLTIEDPIHVEILDSQNNRVKHFKNISLTNGFFSGTFQLSKYPNMGEWNVKVAIEGTYSYSTFKTITIQDYVLPKFSVDLKTPSNIVLEDGHIGVFIRGKYTFNKNVEGNATVELWSRDPFYPPIPLQTQYVDIQNSGYVDFNLKTIKGIEQFNNLFIRATLAEKYTGKTAQHQRSIMLHKQRYNLIVPVEEIEFENNKPCSIKIYVKSWTGAPVSNDKKTPVTMKHGNKRYESFLDENGAAVFEFDYDVNDDYEFQFKDSKTIFPNTYTYENFVYNSREYYCRLSLPDKNLELGKPVRIEVSSIVNIPYFMYVIVGHASLIGHETIKVPPKQKSYTISITPTIEMVPKSYIYVYYIHKGHLRHEVLSLDFPHKFENQISVSAPKEVEPGENVTITVNAQPKSFVGILAVDLGVHLLDQSYDLNKDEIIEELYREISYADFGLDTPNLISGLVTLSNGHVVLTREEPNSYSPGLAGPGPSGPFGLRYPPVRQNFLETWLFDNYKINDTVTKLNLQVPDSLTTWRLTAFSINAATGFGIVDGPTNIVATQTFFISLNLPYAVKRGEIVSIPITIFNYSNQTLDTEVILLNTDKEFYFMESKRQAVEKSTDEDQQKKRIDIAAKKGETVKFLIYPIKTGEINIRAIANSPLYSDAVLQKLKVDPEGVPKQQNQDLYLSIPEGEKISSTLEITDPVESVPDSEYVTFSVGGHYLVPTVTNFQDLTHMPTINGEQNMINFAPSVLILQYLLVNGKLSEEKDLVESLNLSIHDGYQTQLFYRHINGGYSVFGTDEDTEPNTWLTAYVVRYFIKALPFLEIESNKIETGLEYLAEQQQPNGEFMFTGYAINPNHKNEYGLTAFILLAFLEDEKYAIMHQETIEKGIEFLNSNLNNVNDTNVLCLMAAVNKRARRHGSDSLIDKISSLSTEDNGLRWWSKRDNNLANDIEMTANAALSLLETPGDHTSILKWLIKHRNANGGFVSSYDTVVGLEALVKFSEKYTNLNNVNLKISYTARDGLGNEVASNDIHVDSSNVLSLQKHELPGGTRNVTFHIEGSGASLVQLTQQYNVKNVQEFRHFDIQTKSIMKNEREYILELCFMYIAEADNPNTSTNMIIIEVNLPSGYRSATENAMSLRQNPLIKGIETKNSATIVILYLEKLTANEKHCIEILADKYDDILLTKPVAIFMYDYYNLTRSNTEFYSL